MHAIKFVALIVLTTFLMGSSFTVGKLGLAYSSPLLLAGYRFILAGILMAVFVIGFRRPHPNSKRVWIRMLVIGAFQTAGVMGCIFLSLRTITASQSSILTFTNPLLVVILGTILLKIRYKPYQWAGVLLGLTGVAITLGTQLEVKIGLLFGLLSSVCWAVSTLLVKRWGGSIDSWVLSAYQMLFGGLLLLLASLVLERPFFIVNGHSLAILLWLSVLSSIVQFAVWYYVLQRSDPGKTSAFLFLAPFFGVLTGWSVLGEPLHPSIIAGGLCIGSGIFLVNMNLKPRYATTKNSKSSA